METYERRAHGFDRAQMLRMARRCYDVLYEAVTLDAEAERWPIGKAQAHNARYPYRMVYKSAYMIGR